MISGEVQRKKDQRTIRMNYQIQAELTTAYGNVAWHKDAYLQMINDEEYIKNVIKTQDLGFITPAEKFEADQKRIMEMVKKNSNEDNEVTLPEPMNETEQIALMVQLQDELTLIRQMCLKMNTKIAQNLFRITRFGFKEKEANDEE